jgi:hypothetical protein
MRRVFFVFFIILTMLAGCAKLIVLPVSKNTGTSATDKLAAEGMFYALPKTVVRVGVNVNNTVRKAAPFMKFAEIFAPDGKRICEDPKCNGKEEKVKYELQEGVSFSTFGEPDPAHVYMVKFAGGFAIDQNLTMTWNDTGLPSTVSASVTNRTADVVVSGLKLAAGLGTKMAYGAGAFGQDPAAREKSDASCPVEPSNNDAWIIPILQRVTDTLAMNYCDMNLKSRASFDKERDKKQLTLATEAYEKHVLDLAKARETMLMGGKQSMEPAELVGKLEILITQRITELYLGSKKTDTWEGSLDIRKLEVGKEIPILYIHPEEGICIGEAELAPNAKPPKHVKRSDCKEAMPINIVINYYPNEDNQLFKIVRDNTAEPSGDRSFRYRIPAQLLAKIKNTSKTYGAAVFSVAQLGTVASLPARRHSKSMSYDLTFVEATGALKSFKLGTTGGIDTATVDALSGIGGTVIDARNAARKAEQTANDEVTVLTRQGTVLKLKDEICEIQKKYGLPCTVQP